MSIFLGGPPILHLWAMLSNAVSLFLGFDSVISSSQTVGISRDGEARRARAASRLRPSRNANGGVAAEGLSSCSSGPISWLFAAGWIIWDIQLVSANEFSRKSTPNGGWWTD